jgi:hypothetical protein
MPPAEDAALLLAGLSVEARYEEGPFHLPAERGQLLRQIKALESNCQAEIDVSP